MTNRGKLGWMMLFFSGLLIGVLAGTAPSRAIPVLANGQGGVSCSLCHSAVPQLNRYGRYVLMTNFSRGLNAHLQWLQNRSQPLALEMTANASNQPDPTLPKVFSGLDQFLSAGFLGRDVSYFASVPIVSGGFPATSVDQVWLAYNGLSHGNASVQIGRFPTPMFAPWMSQSLSLSPYAIASLPIGLNASTIADNRWGTSYTQFGHLGLVGNISFLRGAGEGSAWTTSAQYLSPESSWSGGVAALSGAYPLPSGAYDRYTRAAGLASYSRNRYEVMAMGVVGRDSNPNDLTSQSAQSSGLSLETIYGPLPWLHLDFRYEHTNDGLGVSTVNYVSDAAFSVRPNIVLTIENRATPGSSPSVNYQLLWAGPWIRDTFPRGSVTPPSAAPAADANALANGRSIYFTGTDLSGTRVSTATPARTYQSCAVCHGTTGEGGVVLADGAISAALGPNAHMRDSMGASAAMPGMTMDATWTLALFERAITHGVDANGEALSPVMPRWMMSDRDLHDVALYISQLRP
ncbi:MAG: c-type cytochrome [Vulcanimicrobiaceae bacterium]